jgi:hypothetical protein
MIDRRIKYQLKHKLSGLCRICSSPSGPNYELCDFHRKESAIKSYEYHRVWVKEKRCSRCAHILDKEIDHGYSTCLSCRLYNSQGG